MSKKANIPWERIEARLAEIGKDPAWLRGTLGVAANVLTNWKSRGAPAKSAMAIAEALQFSTDQLFGGSSASTEFDKNVKVVPLGTRAIPVISAVQAGLMKEIAVPYSPGDGYATIYADDSYSQWAFGLEIEGDSMIPDYRPGDIVIIEPEWEPRPGDCVAAKNGKQEATFKKYRLRGSTAEGNDIFELVPINENYPTMRSDEVPLTIIGVMAELRRKTRRR